VLQQDVGGLDVTVDDPGPVCVGQCVEHLCRDLHGVFVREILRTHRLAYGPTRDVLVGDVHMARVVPDVVRAHAALVPEATRRLSLTLGARGSFPLARDDLQRDVEPGALVAREPDGAGAAATERSHRPIAAEDELMGGRGDGDGRHG
jgi:hypothetical protein